MSGQAIAHAQLSSATPAADGTIATSPAELDLTFSEDINLIFSGVEVVGPNGSNIEIDEAFLAPDDESTLIVPIPSTLPAGIYTVNWHVLSKDGHKIHGSYTFTVKP
jgi:methionine-rich copper-binding protein CopC